VPLAYAVLSLLLWPMPLLGLLHVESAAVIAFGAYFIAGPSSLTLFRQGHQVRSVFLMQEAALLVPMFFLTITTLWRPNCGYLQGLLFFLLFPVVTVAFAVGSAYLLDALNVRKKKIILVVAGLLICILAPIHDIGFHPQFYTYNHVFGGVLGPVYDEELAIRAGLFAFRGLTLAWTALLLLVGSRIKNRRELNDSYGGSWNFAAIGATTALIVVTYAFAAPLGINTTVGQIRDRLTGHIATANFDIYYSPEQLSASQAKNVAEEHEFRHNVLSGRLNVRVANRIKSFLYPDPETKAALTGARYSNVAPIWLPAPQMHILTSDLEHVFPHELAHVFSREFGLPWIRASVAVGLVEGLAVALEPPDGLPNPHEQVSAALLDRSSDDLTLDVAAHLSPWGFWTGRGAVSYTTMGSFITFLLETYGPNPLKDAYAWATFEQAYGKSVERLAKEWTEMLLSLRAVQASSGPLVSARFAVLSLFEKTCPHHIPPYRKSYARAVAALMTQDTVAAVRHVNRSIELEPRYVSSLDLWSRLSLARDEEGEVLARVGRIAPDSMTAALFVRMGDARALRGDSVQARHAYSEAIRRLPTFAFEDRSRLALRMIAAGKPGVIRILVVEGGHKIDEPDPLADWARALVYARQDRYEQAVRSLRTTVGWSDFDFDTEAVQMIGYGPAHVRELRLRRLVWLARFTYRSGDPSAAAEIAREAAARYRLSGAFNEAAAIDDFREKMLWLASRAFAKGASFELLSQYQRVER
jgi:hypothetical protein